MKPNIFFIYLCLLFILCTSCDPLAFQQNCKRDYAFTIPVSLSPALDTFHIGDTISIVSEFPFMMEDEKTGDFFDMSSYPFNTSINVVNLGTNPASCSDTLVQYIENEGELKIVQLTGGCIDSQVFYKKLDSTLIFSCKIILTTEGFFSFGSESFHPLKQYPEIQEACKTNTVEMKYNLFTEGGDSNFDFITYSADPKKRSATRDFFDYYGSFAFFVIE